MDHLRKVDPAVFAAVQEELGRQQNNIELIALMTPMCSNVKGLDYFDRVKSKYPEIHNYENAVEGDEYFSSCGHLNDEGARKFTAIILKDFFGK